MKNTPGKRVIIKRPDDMTKLEFCYMYRDEIRWLIEQDNRPSGIYKECKEFIMNFARVKLNYSPLTANVDIWIGIMQHFKKLIL